MPDPEEWEEERERHDIDEHGKRIEKRGWIPKYGRNLKRYGNEVDTDDYVQQRLMEQMDVDNRDTAWKRERLGRVAKYNSDLKGKTAEELAAVPEDQLDRLVANSDLKRIKQIVAKRDLKYKQIEAKKLRDERLEQAKKGYKQHSYVADATAEQVAKFKKKQEKGDPGFLPKFGRGVKDFASGTLDVAGQAVGVAGSAVGVADAGLNLYTKGRTMKAEIAKAKAKAKSEKKTADATGEEAVPQAKAETKKALIANEKAETEVEGLKSDNRWAPLYHMKKSGIMRMFARMVAGGLAGGIAGAGPWGALVGALGYGATGWMWE
jgi:hypothetical protein